MRVVVVGGGPAGLAFSIEARRFGLDVTMIDRGRSVPILGETIAAAARYALRRLLPDEEVFSGHAPLAGRRARWGSAAARESNSVFSPHGSDRLVDRAHLERSLRARAVALGVQMQQDHAVRVDRDVHGWMLALASARSLRADFLVDATGRAMWLSRRVHGDPDVIDRLVAKSVFAQRRSALAIFEIESAAYGWWYRAPLADGRDVLMLLTDADLLPADIEDAARTTHLGRDQGELTVGPLRPAHSAFARVASGDGWAAVGDAALAWDPLAGSGLLSAFESAYELATAVAATNRDERGLLRYSDDHASAVRGYLEARARAYGSERRWPSSPFWQRRQTLEPMTSALAMRKGS